MYHLVFFSLNVILLYLILILISFDPSDPGWMQSTWTGSITNTGGIIGAKTADFLFFYFGSIAYIIPIIISFFVWIILYKKNYMNVIQLYIFFINISIIFIIFCILAQIIINDIFYFPPGGIIGNVLLHIIKNDNNIIFHTIYIFFFISVMNLISFFYNFFVLFFKKIQKKINLYAYEIYDFFSKKNHKFHMHKQLNFNDHIYSPVCFAQKNILSKNSINNQLKINTKSNVSLNILTNQSNLFRKKSNDYFDQKVINKIKKKSPQIQNNTILFSTSKKKVKKTNTCSIKNISKTYTNVDNFFKKNNKTSINYNLPIFNKKQFHCYENKNSIFPNINLLTTNVIKSTSDSKKLQRISQLIEKKLSEYHITAKVATITLGPVITRFDLNLSAGTKSSKITNLSRDLARSLSVAYVRVIEVIPGTPYVGLEIPNEKRNIISLKDIINSNKFQKNNSPLTLVFGRDISNQPIIEDLRCMPHLLVAGTTGSGKSIGLNVMIIGMLYKSTPEDVRFIMIDPKILELSIYSKIPHLLNEIITDSQDAESILQWCIKEMERRYRIMSIFGVRNLENYNYKIGQLILKKNNLNYIKEQLLIKQYDDDTVDLLKNLKKLPYIVIIIDEFSDLILTTAKKIEVLIIRLTQKARAAGIHIILATQRPSVDVITGTIKANIPSRIAFTVSSKIDSRTILGQSGAESLLGMGDMLYLPPNSSTLIRIHGAYITDHEIHSVVNFWRNQTNFY